ncbi:MAG TPA: hypothetical protein VFA39_07520 [Steroidobacteraceae bacterium]|nr:hypothetical protein [Steroidobacteraceae bacterium]
MAAATGRAPGRHSDHSGGGLPFWLGGGLAGGGALGFVLGGGGGGFCSGAPPGWELGALAGGGACSFDGGVLGLDCSLDGVPPGLLD